MQMQLFRRVLYLQNGLRFPCKLLTPSESATAKLSNVETVFTTSLVGYPESITDPSYFKQLLVFTHPLIGNYGVPARNTYDKYGILQHFESDRVHLSGIVVSDVSFKFSHWQSHSCLLSWCAENNVPCITEIDTRELVTALRTHGSTKSSVVRINQYPQTTETQDCTSNNQLRCTHPDNYVATVSCTEPHSYNRDFGYPHIALQDFGVKLNIIRSLVYRGAKVTVFPWNYRIPVQDFDGVLLSNGPGDPRTLTNVIDNIRFYLSIGKPIFGICLGHQLLGLAAGFSVAKMKFGNRGHNVPVYNHRNRLTEITSQNHGYALTPSTCPNDWIVTHTNLNEDSEGLPSHPEGIRHVSKPFMSVQFHPEAKGGPTDSAYLFDDFLRWSIGLSIRSATTNT